MTGEGAETTIFEGARHLWSGEKSVPLFRAVGWARKGSLAVLDQGLFSGANFLVNILLARWIGPVEYGAFAVGFSIYLVLSGFHNALILEPMSVLGPAHHADRLDRYVHQLVRMHVLVTCPLGFVTVVAALVIVGDPLLQRVLLVTGFFTPITLLGWLARRVPYLRTDPAGALRVSVAYAAATLAGIGILRVTGALSAAAVWLVLALGSAIASVACGLPIRPGKRTAEEEPGLRTLFVEHWGFGRWIVGAALVGLGAGQLQVILAGAMGGLEAAGTLRAMLTTVLPLIQTFTALGLLFVPVMARDYARGDWQALEKKTNLVSGILTAFSLIYMAVLVAFAKPLVLLLYGEQYLHAAWLLPIVGSIAVFMAAGTGFSFSLRAIQKPEHFLVAAMLTGPVGLVTAVSFTWMWGLGGAAASLVSYYVAGLAAILLLYRRWAPEARSALLARQEGTL